MKRISIRTKLISAVMLLMLMIVVFLIIYFPLILNRKSIHSIIDKSQTLVNVLCYHLAPAVEFEDSVSVRNGIDEVLNSIDVVYVAVSKRSSSFKLTVGKLPQGLSQRSVATTFDDESTEIGDNYLRVSGAIRNVNDQIVGYLDLVMSLDRLQSEQQRHIRTTLLICLGFIVVGCLFAYIIGLTISRPIQEVIKGARQISEARNLLALPQIEVKSRDEAGELAQTFNTMVDTLKQTQVSRNYLDDILGTMNDMLIVLSPDAIIEKINPATTAILGFGEDELVGQSFQVIVSGPVTQEGKDLQQVFMGADVQMFEMDFVSKSGEQIPVLFTESILKDKRDRILRRVCIATDYRFRKELERQRKEKQIQLIHAGRLASLGEMATAVAHELNQPLATIRSNIQGLLWDMRYDSFKLEELPEIANETIKQVDRAAGIITHMRGFARTKIESNDPINPAQCVIDSISLFKEQFRLRNIEIVTDFAPDIPLLLINAQQFEQVVVNLLSNARYAVDKQAEQDESLSKRVVLKLYEDEPSRAVILDVSDNGIGMSRAVLDRCLEPFYSTKEVNEGTGLGLSISFSIIKEFGGTMQIESQEGKGTTFSIKLKVTDIAGQKGGRGRKGVLQDGDSIIESTPESQEEEV